MKRIDWLISVHGCTMEIFPKDSLRNQLYGDHVYTKDYTITNGLVVYRVF